MLPVAEVSKAKTAPPATRLACGAVLLMCGVVASWVLAHSDSMIPGRIPPRASLFTVGNWFQALTVAGCGIALLVPRRPAVHSVAFGLALASAGLLFGSSVVGVKHARPYSGISGVPVGYDTMQKQAAVVVVAAAVAAITALLLLLASKSFTASAERRLHAVCVAIGLLVLVVVPVLAGLGGVDDKDLHSQAAYVLMWSLPWGICLAMAAFVERHVAYGLLAAVAVSQICTIVFWPMPDLVSDTARVAGAAGLAATIVVGLALSAQRYDGR